MKEEGLRYYITNNHMELCEATLETSKLSADMETERISMRVKGHSLKECLEGIVKLRRIEKRNE